MAMAPVVSVDSPEARATPRSKTVVVLDTNHLSALSRDGLHAERLTKRLSATREEVTTSVVSVQERIEGWLKEVHATSDPLRQIDAYREFYWLVETYAEWTVLPLDEDAAALFHSFRKNGIRIGTMDLKIACIAITHDALLLTQNTVDFAKVPGLRFENWLLE